VVDADFTRGKQLLDLLKWRRNVFAIELLLPNILIRVNGFSSPPTPFSEHSNSAHLPDHVRLYPSPLPATSFSFFLLLPKDRPPTQPSFVAFVLRELATPPPLLLM
jgi:hypothetical protein